jgi:hypothetical protein
MAGGMPVMDIRPMRVCVAKRFMTVPVGVVVVLFFAWMSVGMMVIVMTVPMFVVQGFMDMEMGM